MLAAVDLVMYGSGEKAKKTKEDGGNYRSFWNILSDTVDVQQDK